VATPLFFPHLKFQHKRLVLGANDSGRRAGNAFEWKLEGHIWNDPKISLFVRLKTLAASGIFWLLFFAVDYIYGINMEQL
jgi:hypothetical protein